MTKSRKQTKERKNRAKCIRGVKKVGGGGGGGRGGRGKCPAGGCCSSGVVPRRSPLAHKLTRAAAPRFRPRSPSPLLRRRRPERRRRARSRASPALLFRMPPCRRRPPPPLQARDCMALSPRKGSFPPAIHDVALLVLSEPLRVSRKANRVHDVIWKS